MMRIALPRCFVLCLSLRYYRDMLPESFSLCPAFFTAVLGVRDIIAAVFPDNRVVLILSRVITSVITGQAPIILECQGIKLTKVPLYRYIIYQTWVTQVSRASGKKKN